MSEEQEAKAKAPAGGEEPPAPHRLEVAPAPHLSSTAQTTRSMMVDVLIGLAPVVLMALWIFRWHAVVQIGICTLSCLAAEAAFMSWRGRRATLGDCSAVVTGVILGLSLPATAPWYVGVVAGGVAIGLGKVVFGGLGQNIFNPAMVGRAFVMICFPAALGAGAYVFASGDMEIVTQATPLTVAKQLGERTPLWPLFLGTVNGSVGETSALACLLGGLWLCIRRSASWEIPAGIIGSVVVLGGIANLVDPDTPMTVLHHLLGGSLLFGAFFIATDPVSSPIAPRGKLIFGIGIGAFVLLIRSFSGYPEGVMFAVLLMNSLVPLINRWTIPVPLGGPVPEARS
jgi:electron transport complex protein RnfD